MKTKLQTCCPETRFKDLINSVQYCDLCPRMNHRIKVLSNLNGNIHSNVLFIAEAPGRLGADKTGIPLFGDKTGNNFEKLIGFLNWKREDIFLTNAILCNPREETGKNGTPRIEEIANCSYYLRMTIELINPKIIVTLGKVALEAINFISPHSFSLSQNVGQLYDWNGYYIVPLYHPGPRALIHRPFLKQIEDYKKLTTYITRIARKESSEIIVPQQKHLGFLNETYSKLEKAIFSILERFDDITLFKLTKLLFLLDYKSIELYGHSITSEIYLREKDGPWLPNLRKTIDKFQNSLIEITFRRKIPLLKLKGTPEFNIMFTDEEFQLLESILLKYGKLSERELKSKVYLTSPMRFILNEEKKGKKMTNTAIIYKNKTIIDHINKTEF